MDRAFFILGTGRCGSTFLYDLLRRHPQIALTYEARVVDYLWFCSELAQLSIDDSGSWQLGETIRMKGLMDPVYAPRFAPVFARHLLPMLEDFYRSEFPDRDFTHWGDKLPHPTAAAAVKHIVPDVRFVLLVRDPRDAVCSWRSFGTTANMQERAPHLVDLAAPDFATKWVNEVGGVRRHVEPLLTLRYEDLVAAPRQALESVLQHIGLSIVPEIEHALAGDDRFESHGTSSSPGRSIGRWRRDLGSEDVSAIESTCADLMRELGYATSRDA